MRQEAWESQERVLCSCPNQDERNGLPRELLKCNDYDTTERQ
jgi:hypothetical protein